jgi:hypothetical protein
LSKKQTTKTQKKQLGRLTQAINILEKERRVRVVKGSEYVSTDVIVCIVNTLRVDYDGMNMLAAHL